MKKLLLVLTSAVGLLGADLTGRWNFTWQTPGGERRTTLTFRQDS